MTTLFATPTIQQSFTHLHHISCSTLSSTSSPLLFSRSNNSHPISFRSQKWNILGSGFETQELLNVKNGFWRSFGIKMSWWLVLVAVGCLLCQWCRGLVVMVAVELLWQQGAQFYLSSLDVSFEISLLFRGFIEPISLLEICLKYMILGEGFQRDKEEREEDEVELKNQKKKNQVWSFYF